MAQPVIGCNDNAIIPSFALIDMTHQEMMKSLMYHAGIDACLSKSKLSLPGILLAGYTNSEVGYLSNGILHCSICPCLAADGSVLLL
jgi:hypothetical protein